MLVGDPGQWLRYFRSLEQRLSIAIDAAWPDCVAVLRPMKGALTHEDPITNQLVAALIKTKKVPGRLMPQYKLLILDEHGAASVSSSIDFVLTIGDREDVYLACECKRLNVPFESGVRGLAAEYVDEGLMRFVQGQYSAGLPLAMMLGYVMDDQLNVAWRNLRRTLGKKASATNLLATQEANTQLNGRFRFASSHICNSGCEIEISHTLLSWA